MGGGLAGRSRSRSEIVESPCHKDHEDNSPDLQKPASGAASILHHSEADRTYLCIVHVLQPAAGSSFHGTFTLIPVALCYYL